MWDWTLVWQLAATFAAAFGLAVLLHGVKSKLRRRPSLADGAIIRMRGPQAVYRTRIIEATKLGWKISAPLQRDTYVPLRPGMPLAVEAPTQRGVMCFQTEIIERDCASHLLEIAAPEEWSLVERREEPRLRAEEATRAAVEGRPAQLLDLSLKGARLLTSGGLARGERVTLDLPNGIGERSGWVLDAQPARFQMRSGTEVRVRFEEPLAHLAV